MISNASKPQRPSKPVQDPDAFESAVKFFAYPLWGLLFLSFGLTQNVAHDSTMGPERDEYSRPV